MDLNELYKEIEKAEVDSFKSGLKSLQRNMGIVILMDHTMMK